MQQNNIPSLTSLRGIAAVWVVLFHIDVSLYYRHMGDLLPHQTSGLLNKGYLWVDFFFLLSGFIIAHVYADSLLGVDKWRATKAYLWARFARIYPLHIFTLCILILFSVVVPLFAPDVIDGSWKTYFAWGAIPSHLLLINAMNQHVYLSWNMVSWSIGAEWWAYLCAPFLLHHVYRRALWRLLTMMCCAALSLILLVYCLPEKNLDITFNYGFIRCLAEFSLGLGLHSLFQRLNALSLFKRDEFLLVLLVAIVLLLQLKGNDLLSIPLFSLLILAAASNQSLATRVLRHPMLLYLGKISYAIYMVHGIWFMVFWFALPSFAIHNGLGEFSVALKLSYTLIFLMLTILSSHIVHHSIEVPARHRLKKFN